MHAFQAYSGPEYDPNQPPYDRHDELVSFSNSTPKTDKIVATVNNPYLPDFKRTAVYEPPTSLTFNTDKRISRRIHSPSDLRP